MIHTLRMYENTALLVTHHQWQVEHDLLWIESQRAATSEATYKSYANYSWAYTGEIELCVVFLVPNHKLGKAAVGTQNRAKTKSKIIFLAALGWNQNLGWFLNGIHNVK